MKNLFQFCLIIIAIIIVASCQEKKSGPGLEGTWKYITGNPGIDSLAAPQPENGQMKTFSKEYFTFVGVSVMDTNVYPSYGAGKYTLDGNKYEETIFYHNAKSMINTHFKSLVEIKNDTLYHSFNYDSTGVGDSWDLRKGYFTEKYVKLN